ncbi:transcriptional regulator [Sphaerisporangium sp. B11E5]|uniref:transcriptional regulator n=1 Tax=Sphaerisporangium sp. B11E5 TaxID=3153563 RepID=UPI00325CB57B
MEPSATTFAVTLAVMYGVHPVADHWVQTHHQASTKGAYGANAWRGRVAAAAHVLTYTATLALALLLVGWRFGVTYEPVKMTLGLGLNAVSHWWADRRAPLAWLAHLVGPPVGEFHRLGAPRPGGTDPSCLGTGAYALDQSWHMVWLVIAAAVMV